MQFKRRFSVTYYVITNNGGTAFPVAHGAAMTVANAVRSSVYRVFQRQYGPTTYAVIADRVLRTSLLEVALTPKGLQVYMTEEALAISHLDRKLRRVK